MIRTDSTPIRLVGADFRRDFPDVFDRMARLERDIGASVLREDSRLFARTGRQGSLWLDELDPDRGSYADEPSYECSLMCAIAETEMIS